MADLTSVYHTMSSLSYKMNLAKERTQRIGGIVACEQHQIAGMRRARNPRSKQIRERHVFWATQLDWED